MIELPSPIYPIDQKNSEAGMEIQEARAKQLQVNRRKRDQIRKRHDYRRNTIDIAQFDLNLGKQRIGAGDKLNLSLSKSATNLSNNNEIEENSFNKRIDEMAFKSKSMPSK
jgi:lipopolysaccharide export system protein LptA